MVLDKASIFVKGNDRRPGQLIYITPLLKEYISPVFSDLLEKAPWYAGIAIGTLVLLLLLILWLIIRIRRRIKRKNKQ